MDFEKILSTYGLPLAGLLVVLFVLRQILWPFLVEQIRAIQKLCLDQLEASQRRYDASADEFMKALERRDKILEQITTTHYRDIAGRLDKIDDKLQQKPGVRR